MAKLTSKNRNALPSKDFAVPARKYPVNDRSHARNALARVSQYGTPKEKAEVRRKVAEKFPGMGKESRMKSDKRVGGMKKEASGTKRAKMHKGEHKGHKAITAQTGYAMKRKKG